jgi:paired amphipathic helix protein Sin3a
MASRERETGDRQHREPYQTGTPHHSSAGSLPIHQPVASRISGAIHSPGGLLANHGSSAPSIPLGAPSGPVASFGGPLHEQTTRPAQQSGPNAPNPQHQLFAPQPHASGTPSGSLGASSGGPAAFSGPLQPQESSRTLQQGQFGGGAPPQHQGPAAAAAAAATAAVPSGLAQGQQPILNVSMGVISWRLLRYRIIAETAKMRGTA